MNRLCFVRFGNLPFDGHSKNYLNETYEAGVSVYGAIEIDGRYFILIPSLTYNACVSLSGVLDRPAYEIVGTPVGSGSDGEPLLKNCKIIKIIEKDKI